MGKKLDYISFLYLVIFFIIMTLFDNLHAVSKKELKTTCRVLAHAFSEDPIIKDLNLESEESTWMFPMWETVRNSKNLNERD